MEQKIREIAQRIKALREIFSISEEEMAIKTDVSLQEYKKLEQGILDFSFTFIYKCAKTMNVEVADILEGSSPTLSSYSVTRKGEGMPITRREGFKYNGIASLFKGKMAEPFVVTAPYVGNENEEIPLSTHEGQELDIVLKGSLKIKLDDHTEILNEGDSIYYDSATPHGMVAVGGKDCEFIAVVLNLRGRSEAASYIQGKPDGKCAVAVQRVDNNREVSETFIETTLDKNGVLKDINFKNEDKFNFAFDIVDVMAEKAPDKLAMLHISADKSKQMYISFNEMKRYSAKAANYFLDLGIKKGDKVMLVLKRHYQFWYAILGLHKIGAIAIPATNLLVKHDFDYRFKAAGVSAIVCTGDGDVARQADLSSEEYTDLKVKIMANGTREGWHDFDSDIEKYSDVYERTNDTACGNEPLLMFFSSGTTGYPKIVTHTHTYALGHYITAKYWHNVNPDGIHFTISDTGWGKALWGKLYGQWLCEAAVFTYDFDKFDAKDILPMFKKYNITTFCAPPTMYRFFIKEDLTQFDLTSLEYITTAGEALNPEVFQQMYKATGLKIMEGFGQTETTLTILNPIGTDPKPGSMGKPSPLYDVDILTADGQSAKIGETGEIVIRTDKSKPCGLFVEYYREPDKTKDVWYDDIYHTGDTAYKDEDGYYWYVGRTDDLIKSSGYRIGPFEIESVIMELPYVLECAVVGIPDEVRGHVVKAVVVLTKNTQKTDTLKKEIQNYVKEHTAPYKYPRIVEFMDALPKTISGKVRRVELRDNN